MDTQDVLSRLRRMEPELRQKGVGALYLFGSRARGDNRDDSDVDLAFDLTEAAQHRFSLLNQAHLIGRISEVLRIEVDLLPRHTFRPGIRTEFDRDAIRVFG